MASQIKPNIVITGFMGTGKSTVAPLIAQMMSREFVDTDMVIVSRANMTIPEIFAAWGESKFRQLEAEVCVDLAAQTNLVVATGGGALMNPDTLAAMSSTGMVVCLTAAPDVIAERLADEREGRPLAAEWRNLLEKRQPYYAAIPYQVNTTGKSPQVVATEVITLWQTVFAS